MFRFSAVPTLLLTISFSVFAADKAIDFSTFKVSKLSDGQFGFVEGPAWDGEDLVYFTDIPHNAIHTYSLSQKTFTQFHDASEGSNGLMFARDGSLLLCQQNSGRVSAMDVQTKNLRPLAETYDDKRFNRPNDLVVDKENGVYFTDPSWSSERPQKVKGLYYLDTEGKIKRLLKDMDKPNGLVLSPNENYLYIVDSANFQIRRYEVLRPGKIGKGEIFAELEHPSPKPESSAADGIAVDEAGRLYVSYRFGVSVFDKQGTHLGTIEVPEGPSNLEFVGKELNELFITAHTNVYKVTLPVRGLTFPQQGKSLEKGSTRP